MIYVKLISGLGNQLFQYAIGRQLSIEKNTNLRLDISFFESQNLRSYKLNHYNINAEIASQNDINKFTYIYTSNTFFAKILRNIKKFLPRVYQRIYKEVAPWKYEEDVFKIGSNTLLEGYWQNYNYFKNISPIIFEELSLKEKHGFKTNTLLSQIISDEFSVSIHIRRGDYITDKEANLLMGILPLSYYTSAINYITEKIGRPSLYFFSDDLKWVKNAFSNYDSCHYIDAGSDYADLDLMSKCQHNIIANSSFSWWGAFLNRNKEKIVIAPKQWVLPEDINKNIELILPDWIKI